MTTTTPLPATPPTLPLAGAPGPQPPPAQQVPALFRALRLALLGEAVLAAVTSVEAAIVATAFGAALPVLLTLLLAVALFVAARSAGRGRVRRWVRLLQWAFLVGAAVDVVAAALTSMPPPALVPGLVRIALPVTVLVLARRGRKP